MGARAENSYDVIVVGARVAGAATAMLLAETGRRVLMVDRSRYGMDTLSTHVLMRGAVTQLHRWDLLGHVIDKNTPPVHRTTFRYADSEIAIPIKPMHGVDALYAPRRTVLDPILVDAAAAAGAEVRYGVAVTGVRRNYKGRVIGIVGRDDRGKNVRWDADLVIGADGVRSTIAQRVAAPIIRQGAGAGAMTYGHWHGLETTGYEWFFRRTGVAGLIPTNDGQTCVFVGASRERVGTGGPEVMRSILREAWPDLADRVAAAEAPPGVRTFTGIPGVMRRPWGPGWALVGDAGYWKDPVSAHGLTDAMRDAELLARAVIADSLPEYQRERDRLSIPFFDTTDRIATLEWDDAEIGGLLLELSEEMSVENDAIAAL
ncbi:MAG TPA: NAD(P)/FAD-dependent oxidoreductase [Acidimicrobiales bacterium]|nr:NAD(P)/FAD-dependent oxidoreductase [Acidimicrobiales bacterium]